jgi:hypothetical protein
MKLQAVRPGTGRNRPTACWLAAAAAAHLTIGH